MLFLHQRHSDGEESAKSTQKTGKAREPELLHSAPARPPGSLALEESPLRASAAQDESRMVLLSENKILLSQNSPF